MILRTPQHDIQGSVTAGPFAYLGGGVKFDRRSPCRFMNAASAINGLRKERQAQKSAISMGGGLIKSINQIWKRQAGKCRWFDISQQTPAGRAWASFYGLRVVS